jgi:hypothetical protein
MGRLEDDPACSASELTPELVATCDEITDFEGTSIDGRRSA